MPFLLQARRWSPKGSTASPHKGHKSMSVVGMRGKPVQKRNSSLYSSGARTVFTDLDGRTVIQFGRKAED
jgi:hypothetical protein